MIPDAGQILMSICDRNMNARICGLTVVEARQYMAHLHNVGITAYIGPDQPSEPPMRLNRANQIGGTS